MRPELAEKYIEAHGMTVTSGTHLTHLFLPYIVMDTARELFDRSIRPLSLRHRAQGYRSEMKRVYHEFCKDFFRPYTRDEQDEIIASFDGFEAFISDELTLARAAVGGAVDFLPFKTQMTLADIILTKVTAQCAGIIYYDFMNVNLPEGRRRNRFIDRYERLAMLLSEEYYKSTGHKEIVKINSIPHLDACLTRLAARMAKFNEEI